MSRVCAGPVVAVDLTGDVTRDIRIRRSRNKPEIVAAYVDGAARVHLRRETDYVSGDCECNLRIRGGRGGQSRSEFRPRRAARRIDGRWRRPSRWKYWRN